MSVTELKEIIYIAENQVYDVPPDENYKYYSNTGEYIINVEVTKNKEYNIIQCDYEVTSFNYFLIYRLIYREDNIIEYNITIKKTKNNLYPIRFYGNEIRYLNRKYPDMIVNYYEGDICCYSELNVKYHNDERTYSQHYSRSY